MLIKSRPKHCKTCDRMTGGQLSGLQLFILILLGPTIVGWIIYFCLASPKLCYMCGLKKNKDCRKNK